MPFPRIVLTAPLLALAACGTATADRVSTATTAAFAAPVPTQPPLLVIPRDTTTPIAVIAVAPAERITPPPPEPTGLNGLPFAPDGLANCDDMTFYREQAGLPARFDGIGWRESNCRNDESVHTSCCYGYWQLWVALHLNNAGLRDAYAACDVHSRHDIDSNTPLDKQRQACAAKALFDRNGYTPWNLTV